MKVKNDEKVLVLVTAQKSSIRLIEYGFSLALATGGELHILHVQEGNSVFDNSDSLRMLQGLVEYGGRLGACVHVQCAKDVGEFIGKFVREEAVTRLVAGQPPQREAGKITPSTWREIQKELPEDLELHVVDEKYAMERRYIG